jgi:lysophospholipid acyltransferase (LPLAT)-like uncharacterized protein
MSLRRKFFGHPWVLKTIGVLGAEYLRLVWNTSRFTIEPADAYERAEPDQPIIIAMWHGQHILAPFIRRPHHNPTKVLISRHRDGEINARAAQRLGIGTVRGSGNHDRRFDQKGGVGAFWAMLASLQEGCNMALTADKFLNAVIAMIHHEQMTITVEQQTRRPIELTVTAAFAAPTAGDLAVAIEDGNALQKIIGEIQVVVAVQSQGSGPNHLPFCLAIFADLAEELVSQIHHLNADNIQGLLMAAARHKDAAVTPDRHRHGQVKTASTLVGDKPDGVLVG